MNNIIWIVLDSCRYDSFINADVKYFNKIGEIEKRYSYASWTSPSHFTFFMGMTPHTSQKKIFASEVYKMEFKRWSIRTGIENIKFQDFVPELSLINKLKKLGYCTIGKVSLPVLNESTVLSKYFDEYKLMDNHNDFKGMIKEISFKKNINYFYFLNLGETHYPYMLTNSELPHISGVHGVFKHMDDLISDQDSDLYTEENFFTHPEMERLRKQQINTVKYCDRLFKKLLRIVPKNTYFIITSDHGELFGENGYFGHGPINHPKVFEVPYIEGLKPIILI